MPPAPPVVGYVPRYSNERSETEMPPACPVDRYVPGYSNDRTGPKCHRLARLVVVHISDAIRLARMVNETEWLREATTTRANLPRLPPG
jgi:hypothetical protein